MPAPPDPLSDPSQRVIQVGPYGAHAEFGSDRLNETLTDIADDASEETHDYYESDAEITSDEIRVWFGVVPPGTPEGSWRDVLPELQPIPLSSLRD
jgi:hypothetical protein